jgi:hypothetical protein
LNNFLTSTFTHYNNPTGAAWVSVATGVACSPPDPLGREYLQQYPTEKFYLMCQVFTEYAAAEPGDRVKVGTVTYVAKSVLPWPALGGLGTFYHLILERSSES